MSFSKGIYRTRAGYKAIIAKLVQSNGKWILKGAVEGPESRALYLLRWDLSGKAIGVFSSKNEFDLLEEDENEKQES